MVPVGSSSVRQPRGTLRAVRLPAAKGRTPTCLVLRGSSRGPRRGFLEQNSSEPSVAGPCALVRCSLCRVPSEDQCSFGSPAVSLRADSLLQRSPPHIFFSCTIHAAPAPSSHLGPSNHMAGLESSAAVAPLSTPVEPAPSWIPSLAHGTAVRPARNQQKASLFPISPAGEAIGDPTLSHADVSSQGPRELRSNENEQHGSDMTPRRGRSLHYRWQKIHLREASPVGRSCDDREKQEEAPESDVGSGEAGESSLCPTKGSGRHEQAPHSRPSASCIATWDVEGGHESGLTLDTTGRPADEGGTSKEPGMGGTNAYEDKAPRDEGGDGKAGKKQTRGRSAVRRLNEKSNRSRASSPDPRGISEESSARKNTTSSSPGLEAGLLSSVRFSSTHQGHQAGMPQPEEFPKSSIPMKKGHSFFGGVGDGGVLRAARSSGKRRGLLFSSLTRSTTAPGRSAADLPSFSRSSSRWHKRLNRPRGDATALQAGRSFRRVSSSSAVDSDQGRSILSRVESVGWVRKLTQARRGTDDPHRGGQGVSSWWRDAVAGDGNRTQVTGKKIPRTSFNQSTQATKWVAWEGADADDRYEEAVAEAERLRRVMVQDIRRPPCPVFSVDYKRQQKGKRLVSARKFESSKIKEVRGRKMYGPPSKRVALAKRRVSKPGKSQGLREKWRKETRRQRRGKV